MTGRWAIYNSAAVVAQGMAALMVYLKWLVIVMLKLKKIYFSRHARLEEGGLSIWRCNCMDKHFL